jgi:choline dehydrogenase-like flavoprotein
VIIGSGYGAGVAASRMARAGKSVAVLELGWERRSMVFYLKSLNPYIFFPSQALALRRSSLPAPFDLLLLQHSNGAGREERRSARAWLGKKMYGLRDFK